MLTAPGGQPGDAFGRSVAISGDTIIVGAPGDDERGENAGAAYVFVLDETGTWRLQQKLLAAEVLAGDRFGWSVAVDGDLAVVGAPGDRRDKTGEADPAAMDRGAAYVFGRVGGQWQPSVRMQPAYLVAGDQYGWAVAVSGDNLAVSAPYCDHDHQGHPLRDWGLVVVYRRAAAGWLTEVELREYGPGLGFSLALHGDDLAVGMPSSWSVKAFSYRRLATGLWTGWSWPSRYQDGPGEVARFEPEQLARDADGTFLVFDRSGLRRLTLAGDVTTLFGHAEADPWYPRAMAGMTVDTAGRIWTAERVQVCPRGCYPFDGEVRRYTRSGSWTLVTRGLMNIGGLAADEAGGVFALQGNTVLHVSESGAVELVATGRNQLTSVTALPGRVLYVVDGSDLCRVTVSTGLVQTVASLGYADNMIAAAPDGSIWVTSWTGSGGTVARRVLGDQVGPPLAGRDGGCYRSIDGTGASACLSAGPLATTADGRLAFLDQNRVRLVSPAGEVRTLAGEARVDEIADALHGYAVAMRSGRVLTGAPRSPLSLSPLERVGAATVTAFVPPAGSVSTVVSVKGGDAFSRYGAAVTFAGSRAALGPANGCLWTTPTTCVDDAAGRSGASAVAPIRVFRQLDDGRWRQQASLPLPDVAPRSGYGSALASEGSLLVAGAPEWDYRPQEGAPYGDIVGPGRVFVYDLGPEDSDGDGLPDDWERTYGLDPTSAAGSDGADGDPDGDGRTNAQEWADDTHPRGIVTRYLAEGATGETFDTRIALLNLEAGAAQVLLRFQGRDGTTVPWPVTVPAHARATVDVGTVAGMDVAEFSTTVESDRALVVDRTLRWDRSGYGAHTETAIAAPATTWYLAEGATHSGFDLFYLLQNPAPTTATVRVRYLRPSGAPLEKTYTLLPNSRTNIWVDHEDFAGLGTVLAATDVSAVVEVLEGAPLIVERAMYLSNQGRHFNAGHDSVGVTAPATEWFLAEGATGPYFDLFILIANPTTTAAQVEVTYLFPDGSTLVKPSQVGASSRFNIWVDYEDARLADTAVSTTVRSTNGVPLIVERAMWWPGGPTTWHEAHNAAGATTTGTQWALAEGEVDTSRNLETYILVANTSSTPADVKVTLLFEDGTSSERTFAGIPGRSRFNVPVGSCFAEAAGKRFGAIVESVGPTPAQIVVERAMYWDAVGQRWAAGTDALATRLR